MTRYLTRAEVALNLGIAERTVEKWVRRGILPLPFKATRAVRWREDEVEAAMERLRVRPEQSKPHSSSGNCGGGETQ